MEPLRTLRPNSAPATVDAPVPRGRVVPRTALVERLLRAPERVVTVVAPPGYGKTTLLTQWVQGLGPRVAWVSCERADNDPATLWQRLVAELDKLEPVGDEAATILSTAGAEVEIVPSLVKAVSRIDPPVTIVLDHVEAITSRACTLSVAELALRVPDGWRLALASREAPPVPLSRLRLSGQVFEIGVDDLAMSHDEGAALLRQSGAEVSTSEADELVRRTEGWPAGIYLAALAIRSGAPVDASGFTGDDRLVEDYLRSELLERLTEQQVDFLVETSILDRLNGPLCDAVTAHWGSARTLADLERHNLFIVPLDRRGEWYRYHHLLRDLLGAELRRRDPGRARELHSRAADWYEANGPAEAAIEHAEAAGDTERLARIVLQLMQPVWASGRVDTVRAWMQLLDRRAPVPYHAAIAAHGALIFALLGRVGEAERWVAVAESLPHDGVLPDGSTVAATMAYLRAILARAGPEQMRADAALALEGLSPASPYCATMLHTQAMASLLQGRLSEADTLFARAYDVSDGFGAVPLVAMVLAEQSTVAAELGHGLRAAGLIEQAVKLVDSQHLESYWTSALVFATAARTAAQAGRTGEARQLARRAARLRPLLSSALCVASLQACIELAEAYLLLVDPAGSLAVLDEAARILAQRPDLGTLGGRYARIRARVDQITIAVPVGASSLTAAELRLVPLLPTHLSLPQIAERLYVSPHTVRTQVKSVYRKLGVSSRAEAVDALADRSERR